MKRFSTMIISTILMSWNIFADAWTDPETGIVWHFRIEDNAAILENSGGEVIAKSTAGNITLPSSIGGCPVTAIGNSAFWNCNRLTGVTIQSGVTSIGLNAFCGCESLATISIPNGVTEIGSYAFSGCLSLLNVTIPSTVAFIAESVFPECCSLKSFMVDEGNLHYRAIDGVLFDESMKTLVAYPGGKGGAYSIPQGVTNVCSGAFYGICELTEVQIPDSVQNLGDSSGSLFSSSSNVLTAISVAEGNPNYASEDGVLFNKSKTELLCWPAAKVWTGVYTIPSTVTKVGGSAFFGSTGLTSISVPATVESIGMDYNVASAFMQATSLTGINVSEANPHYASTDGVLYNADRTELLCMPPGKCGLYEIPDTVLKIKSYAISRCNNLSRLQISSSVVEIDSGALGGCENLEEITVASDNAVYASVDGVLFSKDKSELICCPAGKNGAYVIPRMVTQVGSSAFYLCRELTSIVVPSNVTNFGTFAFYHCDGLSSIAFQGEPPEGIEYAWIGYDVEVRYNIAYEAEWLPVIAECGFTNASPYTPPKYDGGPYVETVEETEWTYVVTNSEAVVKGADAISGSVTIPSTLGGRPVTAIDHSAFLDCGDMTSVTIPASVTEIGSVAFSGCEKLADVWFEGDTIGKIGRHAFLGCYWDLIMHVPAEWQGRGRTIAGHTVWRGGSSDVEKSVNMTVTNVVVQYVLNSIRPEIAVPVSNSVGFVNIITEVASSGAVSVPTEWKDNYQQFETKFGADFGKALAMKTGKKDGAGNDMFVWQDFVAGTDPTDEQDQFTASITIVDGVPVISYTPELMAEQAALRVYKTYGKMKLTDTAWTDITAKTSEERANYIFFKVTVEMK